MIDPAAPDFANTPVAPTRRCYSYAPAMEPNAPAVSIITPLTGDDDRLHETARTILGQSLQQWEWLIVGDPAIVTRALTAVGEEHRADPRIRVMDIAPGVGPIASRNAAVRAAQAPFIACVECGDLLEPTALEKWLWFLLSYPEYSFVTGWVVESGVRPQLNQSGFHEPAAFLDGNFTQRPVLARKQVHHAVGGWDEALDTGLADRDFWLRCAEKGLGGSTVKEFLVWLPRPDTDGGALPNAHGQRPRALGQTHLPDIQPRWHLPYDTIPNELPLRNPLPKKRPRALLLLPWLTIGGSDKFNLDLVEQLVQHHGYEITIATTLTGDQSWMPLFTRYAPDTFVLQNFLRLVDYPRFIRYLIESRQIDVVLMSHSHLGYQLLPYLRAHCPQAAYVDCCHIEIEDWQNGGYPRSTVTYQALLDLAIVTSKHLKNWMVARGADATRIEVCHINVDPQRWVLDPQVRARVRHELSLNDNVTAILFVGRLCDQKQPRVLAQVVRSLSHARLPFVAWIVGDGEDRAWLEQFVRQHQLEASVRLLGSTSYSRIHELLCASDIFFLPSKWEGIAQVLFEAMSCGVAVVAADVGGQAELVTSDCGVLLPRADEATEVLRYTEALVQLLQDPARRARLGQRGRQRIIEQFQLDDMGRRMANLFGRARELHDTQPRETPSRALGLACATEAIEYTRLCGAADRLWQQQNQKSPPVSPPPKNDGNVWTRLALRVGRRRPSRQAALGKIQG